MAKNISTVLMLKDKFSRPAKQATEQTRKLKHEINKNKKAIKKMEKSYKQSMNNMAKSAKNFAKVGGAVLAVGAMKFAKDSVANAKVQIEAETKLQSVFKATGRATKEEIEMLKKHASALQKTGVIGDEVTISYQQQLATFNVSADTVKKLSEGAGDLLAQQKGINATTEDAVNVGNMIGKVMNGQIGALSRVGISFNEAQGEILKYGTEEEKAAVLAEVLAQNVGGVNEALANTDDGKMQQAKNTIGDFQERIGMFLLPKLAELYTWVATKIPLITKKIEEWKNKSKPYINDIKKVIGEVISKATDMYNYVKDNWSTIGPVIESIVIAMISYKVITTTMATITGIMTAAQLALNFALNANPIGLIIIAISALIGVGVLLYKNWDTVTEKASDMWRKLKNGFKGILNFLITGINGWIDILNKVHFRIPDWVPKIGGKEFGFNINQVQTFEIDDGSEYIPDGYKAPSRSREGTEAMTAYAKGGIANKPSVFGEAGPEIAIPLKRDNVRANNLLAFANKYFGNVKNKNTSKGHKPIYVNVNIGDVYGMSDFDDKVADAITKIIREVVPKVK